MAHPLPALNREQMISLLTTSLRQSPSMPFSLAVEAGKARGFEVTRKDFEEAQSAAQGLPPLPEKDADAPIMPEVVDAAVVPEVAVGPQPRKRPTEGAFADLRRMLDEQERFWGALRAIERVVHDVDGR